MKTKEIGKDTSFVFLVLLLLVIFLNGCIQKSNNIIFNDVCSPPCWENIQPGTTTIDDAYNIVSNLSMVDKNSIVYRGQPDLIFDDILIFGVNNGDSVVRIYVIDNKVVEISISGDLGVILSEAIEQLGEPEYVINIPVYGGPPLQGSMSAGVWLIYPKLGYSVSFDTRMQAKNIQELIDPETKIDIINYFTPGLYDNLIDAGLLSFQYLNGDQTRDNLIPWDGYGNLAEKYPQADISDP